MLSASPETLRQYSAFAAGLKCLLICINNIRLSVDSDRLWGLVVRVSGYRYRGPGFDPRRYQIF